MGMFISGSATSTASFASLTLPDNVLKENLLTNSGFDVWSNSTLENVGSNLVTGDDSDFDTIDNWTPRAGHATIASVSGGQAGNCMQVTVASSYPYATLTTTLVIGKLYSLKVYVKQGTDTTGRAFFGLEAGGGGIYKDVTATDSWVQHELVFEAKATSQPIIVAASTGAWAVADGTVLFDTVTLYEVTPACIASDALGPDGWAKGTSHAGLDIWREHKGSNTYDGSFYALKIQYDRAAADDPQGILWPTGRATELTHVERFAGRTVTFGCWVKSSVTAKGDIVINDNDGSTTAVTTGTSYEWLEVTRTCATDITTFQVLLRCGRSEVPYIVYFSQPMLVFGNSIGEGNYTRPQGEIVNCEKHIRFQNDVDPAAGDDGILNLEALSSGMIPKGCKAVHISAFIKNSSVTSDQGISWGPDSTYWYDLQCSPLVNDMVQNANGRVNCDSNGDIYQMVTEAGATLSDLYQDAYAIELR